MKVYYIIDANGYLVAKETKEELAIAIAEEIGGDYFEMEQSKKIKNFKKSVDKTCNRCYTIIRKGKER